MTIQEWYPLVGFIMAGTWVVLHIGLGAWLWGYGDPEDWMYIGALSDAPGDLQTEIILRGLIIGIMFLLLWPLMIFGAAVYFLGRSARRRNARRRSYRR